MGQKSSIDKLPKDLRAKLLEMLADPACTQAEIVEAINAEAGEDVVSRSGVNRYALRMKKFAEKTRQAREVADWYIEKNGADTNNVMGRVVQEQIRTAVFDLMQDFEELKEKGTDGEDTKSAKDAAELLYKLSRGLRELEQAEKINAEREETIRKSAIAEAAEVATTEAKNAGLDESALELIKRKILGI